MYMYRCCLVLLMVILLHHGQAMAQVLTPAANPPDNNGLYDYRNTIALQEEFISGTAVSGNIGALGWTATGGTTSQGAPETNHPGILRRATSAVINTVALLRNINSNNAFIGAAQNYQFRWVVRLNQTDADTKLRVGITEYCTVDPCTYGVYFEKLGTDTNWTCVTRTSSVETKTDSSVAANTSWHTFHVIRSPSQADFYLDGALVCSNTTNLPGPTAQLLLDLLLINTAAADKTVDVDYADFMYSLSR